MSQGQLETSNNALFCWLSAMVRFQFSLSIQTQLSGRPMDHLSAYILIFQLILFKWTLTVITRTSDRCWAGWHTLRMTYCIGSSTVYCQIRNVFGPIKERNVYLLICCRMEYHTEYSILCSECPQMVSCVKVERWNFILTLLANPPKIQC